MATTTTSSAQLTAAQSGSAALDRFAPLAWPLVRVVAGVLLVPHGAQKLFGWFGGYGPVGTAEYFGGTLGLEPGMLFALTAGIIEFFGGLALALGLLTRPVALIVAGFLAVTITFHWGNGLFWTSGGFEYPLLWSAVALAIFFRGGGEWSLDGRLRS